MTLTCTHHVEDWPLRVPIMLRIDPDVYTSYWRLTPMCTHHVEDWPRRAPIMLTIDPDVHPSYWGLTPTCTHHVLKIWVGFKIGKFWLKQSIFWFKYNAYILMCNFPKIIFNVFISENWEIKQRVYDIVRVTGIVFTHWSSQYIGHDKNMNMCHITVFYI